MRNLNPELRVRAGAHVKGSCHQHLLTCHPCCAPYMNTRQMTTVLNTARNKKARQATRQQCMPRQDKTCCQQTLHMPDKPFCLRTTSADQFQLLERCRTSLHHALAPLAAIPLLLMFRFCHTPLLVRVQIPSKNNGSKKNVFRKMTPPPKKKREPMGGATLRVLRRRQTRM
jgi:hypothetical protein